MVINARYLIYRFDVYIATVFCVQVVRVFLIFFQTLYDQDISEQRNNDKRPVIFILDCIVSIADYLN